MRRAAVTTRSLWPSTRPANSVAGSHDDRALARQALSQLSMDFETAPDRRVQPKVELNCFVLAVPDLAIDTESDRPILGSCARLSVIVVCQGCRSREITS